MPHHWERGGGDGGSGSAQSTLIFFCALCRARCCPMGDRRSPHHGNGVVVALPLCRAHGMRFDLACRGEEMKARRGERVCLCECIPPRSGVVPTCRRRDVVGCGRRCRLRPQSVGTSVVVIL
ncbi:hypothetical protein I4F81_009926 [Pyropia yezoensis]|uniref:Uncharacterized protein n=1 Tax=Pyropia yezoensis TaxID=2788 RepID=A0ACC3CB81_PYRYE|nr:hypothetical protein I4F81_009926 [Neopyropia yezoensis]